MQKTILVLGGTGLLGQPVARRLQADGFKVKIMTRDAARANKLFDSSFQVLAKDPANGADLEQALEGCYGVLISLPTEVEQQVAELVAKSAARCGVQRIGYVSGATVASENRWFAQIDRKARAEEAVRGAGVPYTIFCPTWFMESLPAFVTGGRASVFGKQPHPFHWVAAEDYARMVSTAFGVEAAANKRLFVLGPEALSMRDALQTYITAFNPEVKSVSTMPFWVANSIALMSRNEKLKSVSQLMAYFEKTAERGDPAEANKLLGAPQTTLAQWIAARKSSAVRIAA